MMISQLLVTTFATTVFACAHAAPPTTAARDCTPVLDAIKRAAAAALLRQRGAEG